MKSSLLHPQSGTFSLQWLLSAAMVIRTLMLSVCHINAQQLTISFPASTLDDAGDKILAEFQKPFSEGVKSGGGRQPLDPIDFVRFVGVKGTRKPSGAAAYLGATQSGSGIALYFAVKMRIKVDVGGWQFTTKIAEVETHQILMLSLIPKTAGNSTTVEARLQVVDEYRFKDGQAKASDLEELASKLRETVLTNAAPEISKLQQFLDSRTKSLFGQVSAIPGFDPSKARLLSITLPEQDQAAAASVRQEEIPTPEWRRVGGRLVRPALFDVLDVYKRAGVIEGYSLHLGGISMRGGGGTGNPARLTIRHIFHSSLRKYIQAMPLHGGVSITIK
jgi:hypothetical protein